MTHTMKPKWSAQARRSYIQRKRALARMHDRAILREMRQEKDSTNWRKQVA